MNIQAINQEIDRIDKEDHVQARAIIDRIHDQMNDMFEAQDFPEAVKWFLGEFYQREGIKHCVPAARVASLEVYRDAAGRTCRLIKFADRSQASYLETQDFAEWAGSVETHVPNTIP